MKESGKKMKILSGSLLLAVMAITPFSAKAQMGDNPWGFSGQNRASIAALIKQVEDADKGTAIISGGGDIVNLVCGADASSSATGNSSCIILNNSDADINIGQDSEGDQTASTEETTNVEETINGVEGIDDVLDTLSGDEG